MNLRHCETFFTRNSGCKNSFNYQTIYIYYSYLTKAAKLLTKILHTLNGAQRGYLPASRRTEVKKFLAPQEGEQLTKVAEHKIIAPQLFEVQAIGQ
jgi:hypothetical protein